MAKTFRGTAMAGLVGWYANSDTVAENVQRILYGERKKFTSGSGDNQADRLIVDAGRELAAATRSYELDAIADVWGDTISLAKVRLLIIEHLTLTSGYDLTLSGDWVSSNGIQTTVTPGGVLQVISPVDGVPVTSDTADTLTLDPGANTISVNVIILGND